MEFPKNVKVGGMEYKIIFPYQYTERCDEMGQACHGIGVIRVANRDSSGEEIHNDRSKEVLLHEIMHIIDWVYNSQKMEEDTVDRMSHGLFQVIRDNPDVINKIMYKEKEGAIQSNDGKSKEGSLSA